MEKNFPGYLPITFRKINLVRRQGKYDEADRLYKEYVESCKVPQIASLYALKQARYRHKVRIPDKLLLLTRTLILFVLKSESFQVLGDEAGAIKILNEAIENDKVSL